MSYEKVKRWRAKQPPGFRRAEYERRYHARASLVAIWKLEHGCQDCGMFPKQPEVLDFDHVRGQKVTEVSLMRNSTLEALVEEIEKCDVVCANCHRIRTFWESPTKERRSK